MTTFDEMKKQEIAEAEKAREERLAKQLEELKKKQKWEEEKKEEQLMSDAISDLERSLMHSRSSLISSRERDALINEKRKGLRSKRGKDSSSRDRGGVPSSMAKSSSDRVNLNFSSQVADSAM